MHFTLDIVFSTDGFGSFFTDSDERLMKSINYTGRSYVKPIDNLAPDKRNPNFSVSRSPYSFSKLVIDKLVDIVSSDVASARLFCKANKFDFVKTTLLI